MKSTYKFLLATGIIASITVLIFSLDLAGSAASVSLLYLLGVTISALVCGRAASIYAALIAFLTFDYFFVSPIHTLSVRGPAEWIALGTFLITALVIGQLIQTRDELMKAEARAAALADADKLKTALLSMISHDFRSPLTSIKAFVSTLLADDGAPMNSDEQRSLYQGIEMEADRLNRMVGNVLDLSRLEANAWKPHREWIPVSEITGMSLSNFSTAQNERIKVEIDSSVSEIFVDSTQVSSVIKNLVENALKYSPENKSVLVQIASEPDTVAISVTDEGRGLPQEVEDVFKPFWRAPDLQESHIPGVGIGLAVCRGLVEAHGGKLLAEQRKPLGACFTVLLPRNANDNEVALSGQSISNR